jgi:SAM-dependent methyltransferase
VQDGGIDLRRLATDRAALVGGQYASKEVLESRVSIYAYLVQSEQPAAAAGSFEAWVADHVAWSGRETAIDVGCGPGPYFQVLGQRAAQVVGLDLSFGMLTSISGERMRGVAAVAADAQWLPIASCSVDVVVCAHMLYHVPDIALAFAEVRRVLRPGGHLLAAANGVRDKLEILQVWAEAATAVLGRPFHPPSWGERFNLDIAADMAAPMLEVVAVDRSEGRFVLPDAGPALVWIDSLRGGTEGDLTDEEWQAVLEETGRRINDQVGFDGSFAVTKSSGALVARRN